MHNNISQINQTTKNVQGVVLISISTDTIADNKAMLSGKANLVLAMAGLLLIVLAFFSGLLIVRPFKRITRSIGAVTEGYEGDYLKEYSYTETRMLSEAFNKMLGRMKVLSDSRNEFVSNVSHELKTPLASMKVLSDSLLCQQDVPIELYQEFMNDLSQEIERESKIIDDLLALVKLDKTASGMNIRVGNLTSRTLDYKFQPNYRQNAFLTRVKAILEFGLFPDYLLPLYSEFSPIDLTAEGVVKIAQYVDKQTVFHLNSNHPIYFDRFIEVVHELGISMKVVDGNIFTQALRKTVRDRVMEYIFEAFQNDMDEQGRLLYDSNIHIQNDFTVWFLKKAGFEWSEIDMEYIRGYVEYFRGIGYLEV